MVTVTKEADKMTDQKESYYKRRLKCIMYAAISGFAASQLVPNGQGCTIFVAVFAGLACLLKDNDK